VWGGGGGLGSLLAADHGAHYISGPAILTGKNTSISALQLELQQLPEGKVCQIKEMTRLAEVVHNPGGGGMVQGTE